MIVDGATGLLVPPGDKAALTTALSALATDAQLRDAMGAAARRRIEREFSLQGMIHRYEELYVGVGREMAG